MTGEESFLKKFINGDILVQKGLKNVIPFAITVCVIIVLIIAWSLMVEGELAKQEKLEEEVNALRIEYTHKELELTGFNQRSKIIEMLGQSGSDLHAPDRPAVKIETK